MTNLNSLNWRYITCKNASVYRPIGPPGLHEFQLYPMDADVRGKDYEFVSMEWPYSSGNLPKKNGFRQTITRFVASLIACCEVICADFHGLIWLYHN